MTQDVLTSSGLAATVFPWQEVWRRPHNSTARESAVSSANLTRIPALVAVRAAGRPIRLAGWDLGRNDHTDELDWQRPAEPHYILRAGCPYCTLSDNSPDCRN